VELQFFSKTDDIAHSFWRKGADTGAENKPLTYDKKIARFSGKVQGSLVESIKQVIKDELAAYRFMDAYLLDYENLAKILRRNARFSLSIEKLYLGGTFLRFGQILETQLKIADETIVKTYKPLPVGGFYYGGNVDHSARPFFAPVDYVQISSLFQKRRYHPIKKFRRAHLGVDFERPSGAAVYAAASGEVLRFGRNRAAGNYIVLRHSDGFETYYDHLHQVESFDVGQTVRAGAKIGAVGCTGYCTKPHLHFAVKKAGQFINPILLVRGYTYEQQKEVSRYVAQAQTAQDQHETPQ